MRVSGGSWRIGVLILSTLAASLAGIGCAKKSFEVGRWVVRKSRDPDVPLKKQVRLEFRGNSSFVYTTLDATGREDRREGDYRFSEPGMILMKFAGGLEWEAAITDGKEGPILEFTGKGGMRDVIFCIPDPRKIPF